MYDAFCRLLEVAKEKGWIEELFPVFWGLLLNFRVKTIIGLLSS